MKVGIMVIAILFIGYGCQEKEKKNPDKQIYPQKIEFSMVGHGNLLGNGIEGIDAGSVWITGTVEWKDLLDKMNVNNRVSDSFISNDIDFKNYDVVACFDIVRPHTGYIITVDRIVEDANNRVIHLLTRKNNRGIEVPSQPYYLLKMRKSEKTVMFQ